VNRLGDVLRDSLESEPARLFTTGVTAHAVRYNRDESDTLVAANARGVRKTGVEKLDLLLEGAQEEVILVVLSHLARMRETEHVDLIIHGPSRRPRSGVGDIPSRHAHSRQQLAQM
jgi:hypothetical protein